MTANENEVLKLAAEKAEIRDILGKDCGTEGERLLNGLNRQLFNKLNEKERGR